ncbi:MAG: hypothetical protein ABIF71_02255 [Planctomycetota bacterium]
MYDLPAHCRITRAPALPPPTGAVIRVRTGNELAEAVHNAIPGATILLDDGTYVMPRGVVLTADDVTIRSAGGDRDAVVLDGAANHMEENLALLSIRGARRVCIADLTFRNSRKYGLHFYADSGVHGLMVWNVVFHNIWARGLKGTSPCRRGDAPDDINPPEAVAGLRPRGGAVRHCLFIADHVKTDLEDGFDGDYISGMDMMYLTDWTIADNTFVGLWGAHGWARGAIFIWVETERLTVDRNYFYNCDWSIALGNPSSTLINVRGAVVRDNLVVAGANRALECNWTAGVEAYNNIYATQATHPAVEIIRGSQGCRLHHNIIHGTLNCEPAVVMDHNHTGEFEGCFNDPASGDLGFTEKGRRTFGAWRVCWEA